MDGKFHTISFNLKAASLEQTFVVANLLLVYIQRDKIKNTKNPNPSAVHSQKQHLTCLAALNTRGKFVTLNTFPGPGP